MQQQHKLSLEAVQTQTTRTRQAIPAVSSPSRGGCSVLEYDPASQPSDWGGQVHSGLLEGQQLPQSSSAAGQGVGESRADGAGAGPGAGPHRLAVGRWILTQQMLHQERRLSAGQHRYLSLLGAHSPLS